MIFVKKNPIINSQAKQDIELENLEKNVSLVKAMLEEKGRQIEDTEEKGVLFQNTNILPTEENNANKTGPNLNVNNTRLRYDEVPELGLRK